MALMKRSHEFENVSTKKCCSCLNNSLTFGDITFKADDVQ